MSAVRRASILLAAVLVLRIADILTPAPLKVETSAEARALRLRLERALQLLPGFNVGKEGHPGNALNIVFVAKEEELLRALGAAGWTRVPHSLFGSTALGFCELAEGRWPAAFPPMHNYSLFGREQDLNFSIQSGFPYSRHHFRLWKSPFADEQGRAIWWASADFDVGIRWSDLSHVPDPNIDQERNFLASTLIGLAKQLRWIPLSQIPKEGSDDRGYPYKGDGKVLLATF
jgi:hypothetical protein